jgi:hypothetical protein
MKRRTRDKACVRERVESDRGKRDRKTREACPEGKAERV